MKINLGNIFVSTASADIVRDMFYSGKLKNYSHVVDEIITHYVNMSEQHVKLVKRIQELVKENTELKQNIGNYREQIVKPSNPLVNL